MIVRVQAIPSDYAMLCLPLAAARGLETQQNAIVRADRGEGEHRARIDLRIEGGVSQNRALIITLLLQSSEKL